MVLSSALPRNATEMVSSWKWFPASSVSSPDSELGSGGGGGDLTTELQVTAGLCSHSCECAGGANLSESLWGKAAKGPGVSILGWTEPWLTRSQAGESPAFPGGPCGAVPSLFLGFHGVTSSQLTATVQEKHKDPDVVTDPEPVKRSV